MPTLYGGKPIPGYKVIALPDCCMTCTHSMRDYDGDYTCGLWRWRHQTPVPVDAGGLCDRFQRDSE